MPNAVETKSIKQTKGQNSFITFFKNLKSEFKRITWPSYKKIKKSTIEVIIFCLIFVVITGLLDEGFKRLFSLIFTK